jgi:Ca2+-binding EF-hand superfamily protein
MKTYFERIDFDKDGAITRKDFEGMGERFVEAEKVDEATGKIIKEKICAVWDNFLSQGGKEGLPQGDFIDLMRKQKDDPKLKDSISGPLPLFFDAVDANNDGFIDCSEHGIFFKIIGLGTDMSPASFQAIDTNEDNLLSREEFITAGTEFFLSEDTASPTKLFWGPLVAFA